jgi:hypothetical protein
MFDSEEGGFRGQITRANRSRVDLVTLDKTLAGRKHGRQWTQASITGASGRRPAAHVQRLGDRRMAEGLE